MELVSISSMHLEQGGVNSSPSTAAETIIKVAKSIYFIAQLTFISVVTLPVVPIVIVVDRMLFNSALVNELGADWDRIWNPKENTQKSPIKSSESNIQPKSENQTNDTTKSPENKKNNQPGSKPANQANMNKDEVLEFLMAQLDYNESTKNLEQTDINELNVMIQLSKSDEIDEQKSSCASVSNTTDNSLAHTKKIIEETIGMVNQIINSKKRVDTAVTPPNSASACSDSSSASDSSEEEKLHTPTNIKTVPNSIKEHKPEPTKIEVENFKEIVKEFGFELVNNTIIVDEEVVEKKNKEMGSVYSLDQNKVWPKMLIGVTKLVESGEAGIATTFLESLQKLKKEVMTSRKIETVRKAIDLSINIQIFATELKEIGLKLNSDNTIEDESKWGRAWKPTSFEKWETHIFPRLENLAKLGNVELAMNLKKLLIGKTTIEDRLEKIINSVSI